MVAPIKVYKKACQEFESERWNAYMEITLVANLEDLTPVQRKAHLANWYMNEVYNGGHWQYFCNKAYFDHQEVVEALQDMGAKQQASVLIQAIARLPKDIHTPKKTQQFFDGYDQTDMYDLDDAFNSCDTQIEEYLEHYLDRYESEFIEWIP